MSRFRLIFEGEFKDPGGVIGVSEQVAARVEDIGDVRLVEVRDCLAGCLICRHGEPVEGTWYRRVRCSVHRSERMALDHCMRFEPISICDSEAREDASVGEEIARRCEAFNKLNNWCR